MNNFKMTDNIDTDVLYELTNIIGHQLVAEMTNSQTILQILVQKGVCTPDEVKEMRDKVERCSKSIKSFKTVLDAVNEKYNKNVEENELIYKLFAKNVHLRKKKKQRKSLMICLIKNNYISRLFISLSH